MNFRIQSTDSRMELHKFFTLAAESSDLSKIKMPRCIIDASWHLLLQDDRSYIRFCADSAGTYFGHAPGSGTTEMLWVERYEELYGKLSPLWFTSEDGQLSVSDYNDYLQNGKMIASWDCGPILPDKGRTIQGEIDNLRKVIDINRKVTDLNDINIPGVDKIPTIDDVAIIDSIKDKIDRFNIDKIRDKYKN